VSSLGVIGEFAKMRVKDVQSEAQNFVKAPVKYVRDKQVLRKALLLEWLDHVRPVVGTKYEHWVEEVKRR
jgi:hypothetical protein